MCEKLIRIFTKEKDLILDPFCGVGGTLLACDISNRAGIGIEINKEWIDIYRNICKIESITPQRVINGDSREILRNLSKDPTFQFDFILTDVPFWKMDTAKKSKGTYKKVGEEAKGVYSDKSKLTKFNAKSQDSQQKKHDWELLIKETFTECFKLLKPGRYCAVFIGNMYADGSYHLLNADIARILSQIGYVLKGEIVWYDVNKKLHLYGINYSWIPSIVHQFIMVFRKERNEKITQEEKDKIKAKNIQMTEKG